MPPHLSSFLLIKTALFFSLLLSTLNAAEIPPAPIVAAYYENFSQSRPKLPNRPTFSPNMIDPDLLTDLYYAFASFGYISKAIDPLNPRMTGDFSIQPTESNDQTVLYPQIMDLKKRSTKGLKIFLSIGGWSFNDPDDAEGVGTLTYRLFSQMVAEASSRKKFINSAIDYAHRYGFDGIDIDWEYPGDLKRGGSINDFSNFIEFLKECSTAFLKATPPLLLSMAAPAFVPANIPQQFHEDPDRYFKWLADCAPYLDRINIMAYDYHGSFDEPKITGVNAPLNRDTNPNSSFYIAKALQNYLKNGVPPNKMVLGLPTFGHSYAKVSNLSDLSHGPGKPFEAAGAPGPATRHAGFLAYFEIDDLRLQDQLIFGFDRVTDTENGYHLPTQTWVSFDTPDTIKLKAQKALENNLRGVMFWAIDMDEYQKEPKYPNIRSAWNIFYTEHRDFKKSL